MKKQVLQDWVVELSFMQQSVLMASVRGPDGINKNHISKLLIRWMRRSFLISAFDNKALDNPYFPGGGSFTGPSLPEPIGEPEEESMWEIGMDKLVTDYLKTVDELPHHFQLHFMHAAEILGYKHSNERIRVWWHNTYLRLVNDLHLMPETDERMNWRLGDKESSWRAAEEITADNPK